MTALAVIGTGLVTPLGRTAAEHALFVRAEVGPSSSGAFLDEEGEPIPVAYCPWLGAHGTAGERLAALAAVALRDALQPLERRAREEKAGTRAPVVVLAISSAPRAGLGETDRCTFEGALGRAPAARGVRRLTGEAGLFEGLALCEDLLAGGEIRAIALVAADSYVTRSYLAEHRARAGSPWDADLPLPSEGAAALVVTTPQFARDDELDVLATVRHAATRRGEANDDNDVPLDGAAMSALLRALPDTCRPLGASFGPHGVGPLRDREWNLAAASCAALLGSCACISLEGDVGRLGAASGAASVVYGIAVHQHGAWPVEPPPAEAPLLAWAISPDGTRGIAALHADRRPAPVCGADALATQRAPELRDDPPDDDAESGPEPPASDGRGVDAPEHGEASPAVPQLTIDPERAAPVPVHQHYAAVIAECLERMAMLSRHRDERPWREHETIEARLFAQARAVVEARASAADLLTLWDEAEDDPRMTWAVVFTLRFLDGDAAVEDLLGRLPGDAIDHAQLAADALVAGVPREGVTLGRELFHAARPLVRAVGLEVLSRLGQLGAEDASKALDDGHAEVEGSALRALARLAEHDAAVPRIRARLTHADPAVVWEAARALTLFGHRDAYAAVRENGPLSKVLGSRALEILVLAGAPEDIGTVERIVRRAPMSAEMLSAVARFGHPAAWPYLVRALERPELADEAGRALVTLFGPLSIDAPVNGATWRPMLEGVKIPATLRLRRGEPWTADAVVAECASGELPRREIEVRRDELRARRGASPGVDLSAWGGWNTA
jgi:HEAT repeats